MLSECPELQPLQFLSPGQRPVKCNAETLNKKNAIFHYEIKGWRRKRVLSFRVAQPIPNHSPDQILKIRHCTVPQWPLGASNF